MWQQGIPVTFTVPYQCFRLLGTPGNAEQQEEEAEDFKSYAPSGVGLEDITEACQRLGWTFSKRQAAVDPNLVDKVPKDLPKVPWDEREVDTTNKVPAAAAMSKALCLPGFMAVVKIERVMLLKVEGVHSNKRTRVTGKTDFAVVYSKVLNSVQLSPKEWLHAIFLLLETKTTHALKMKLDESRAAGALECLAANLTLEQRETLEAVLRRPEGLAVLLTDVNNTCFGYIAPEGQHNVEELWFNNRFEAFAYFGRMLQNIKEPVELIRFSTTHNQDDPAEGGGMAHGNPGNAGPGPSTRLPPATDTLKNSPDMPGTGKQQQTLQSSNAELLEADILEAGRDICSQLGLDAAGPDEVYIETWEHALLRARFGQEVANAYTQGQEYMRVPPSLAGLYVQ